MTSYSYDDNSITIIKDNYKLIFNKETVNKKSGFKINDLKNELKNDIKYIEKNILYNECISTYLFYVIIKNERKAIYYFLDDKS